ncbi:MAG: 2-C-methyl-D-erythritol 2,4-cyclodiphosphate synthase [Clostridia bacterium]|jgi:2-C-methyl-D-erythritol 2,4-cyclodiphosphate synthase|nr:2-C-methyl-D-erythritol 2,4-cyclodiphosphate synthase [Clostridia bacterium]
MRVGFGYDVHRLTKERRLILGGVEIPHTQGLLGHSDADALLHAVMDALLGAAGLGDIGEHFPDGDTAYRDIDSRLLLKQVYALLREKGYRLGNLDCTIVAQKPKLAPYKEEMKQNIGAILEMTPENVNIKATTTESLGFAGREEGIACYAVCTLTQK